ncbi:MAG: hypothetical protein KIT02_07540 [Devosia sp.]|uniref:hypothetical protein n=1 Tax=Devosia sp. TaxID=1871048 RepID=UPI0024CA9AF5|nr:hypothetical protein [Devosia sp.]UYO01045.1 MAG: hypothetical protein KIT02_07540 [Devosia sp.]
MCTLRAATTASLMSLALVSPAVACTPELYSRLEQSLPSDPDETIETLDIQSTEGGEWQVWHKQGRARLVARIDYGEMGRQETQLVVQSPAAYGVTQTRYVYSVPIYLEGSALVRKETDFYLFCDGALVLPPEDLGAFPEYEAAAEAARSVFDAPEIAAFLPDLKR